MKRIIQFIFRIKPTEIYYEQLVNPKKREGLKRYFKIGFFTGLILLSSSLKSQPIISAGLGYDFKHNNPTVIVSPGIEKGNIVLNLLVSVPIIRKVASPLYMGGNIGFDIEDFIIPSIGYYDYYTSDGGNKVNKGVFGYSVKVNRFTFSSAIGDIKGFTEASLIGESFQIRIGISYQFKNKNK
jgi:hypothetical protein